MNRPKAILPVCSAVKHLVPRTKKLIKFAVNIVEYVIKYHKLLKGFFPKVVPCKTNGKDKKVYAQCFNVICNCFLAANYFVRQLKCFRQPWNNIFFCKTKCSNKLGSTKYLQLKLVILMVKVNLPRLNVIMKQNKL